jgi:O-antigen ligase
VKYRQHLTASSVGGLGLALVALGVALPGLAAAALVVATVVFLAVFLAAAEKPLAPILVTAGWGWTVFTTEAGLSAGEAASSFSATKIVPIAILGLGLAMMLVSHPPLPNAGVSTPAKWFLAYLAWQTLCVTSSPFPELSGPRVIQALLPLVVIIVMTRRGFSVLPLVGATVLACVAHVALALAGAGAYVGLTGEKRLIGLLIANSFAFAAAFAIVGAIGLWQGRMLPSVLRLLPIPVVLLAAYAIAQTVGRTASIAVPVALVVGTVFFGGSPRREGVSSTPRVFVLVAMLGGLLYASRRADALFSWFSTGNRSLDTLTGRVDLWGLILDAVSAKWLFGYGPGAMRFQSPELAPHLGPYLRLGQAHNSFMEALVNSGYIGALLWLSAMFALSIHAWRVRDRRRPLAITTLVLVAVSSLTIANASGFGIAWYVLMLVVGLTATAHPPMPTRPLRDVAGLSTAISDLHLSGQSQSRP